jgi:hypothetical protein
MQKTRSLTEVCLKMLREELLKVSIKMDFGVVWNSCQQNGCF